MSNATKWWWGLVVASIFYLCVHQIAYRDGYDRCMADNTSATDAEVQALIEQLGRSDI